MEPRLNFVTLVVADLARARRFYVDGLGWKAAFTGDDVLMIHVGQKLVLSLWSEAGAREEIGEVTRGGTPGTAPGGRSGTKAGPSPPTCGRL